MVAVHTCRKTYGAEEGLSTVFRQHRATSHCAKLHGYALGFSFEFGAAVLDRNGWVVDFGALKPLKRWLHTCFDHVVVVAEDDPMLPVLENLADHKLLDVNVLPRVGCEAFAEHVGRRAAELVADLTDGRAHLVSCTVSEHGGNSVTWHALGSTGRKGC